MGGGLFALPHERLQPDDPYAVPMNPGAEFVDRSASSLQAGRVRVVPRDQIEGCDWRPCVEGCCLGWKEVEKSNAAMAELQRLIDHFLRPGAMAPADGRPDFDAFTFDHHVSGTVAAERDDTRELFLLVAENNVITKNTLVAGGSQW